MDKINFTNGQAPAINGTNLNQLQTNMENAINGVQKNVTDLQTNVENNMNTLEENIDDLQENINNIKHEDITKDGEPAKCGYKIDDKDVYVKKVEVANLPNASGVSYPTGLTNIKYLKIEGMGYRSTDGTLFPLPFATDISGASILLTLGSQNNTFQIQTWMDRSNVRGEIYIYFTNN